MVIKCLLSGPKMVIKWSLRGHVGLRETDTHNTRHSFHQDPEGTTLWMGQSATNINTQ